MTPEKKQEILKSLEEYKTYELTSFKRELEDFIFNKMTPEEKAQVLKDEVCIWIDRNFNQIDLSALEKVAGENGFYENIMQREPSLEDFMQNEPSEFQQAVYDYLGHTINPDLESLNFVTDYNTIEEVVKAINENFNDLGIEEDEFTDEIKESREYESYKERENQNNYPLWSYCFEMTSEHEQLTENALTFSGIGVISGLEDFNDILFFKSAGHSFYSSYWIPLYLKTFTFAAKKYEGVNYEHI